MSWQATAWAERQKTGSAARKALLMILANYADEHGKCWPSQETLAAGAELSTDTIQRELREMVTVGLISIERTARRSGRWSRGVYQLHLDREVRVERAKRKLRGAAARAAGEVTEPQPAARCDDHHHAATCGPDRAATCGLDHAAPCGTNLQLEPSEEEPPTPRACELGDLLAIWPAAHARSRKAIRHEWQKVAEEGRVQLLRSAPAYLAHCKREQFKLVDLRRYIADRYDERFTEQPTAGQTVELKPGSSEWIAYRACRVERGENVSLMDERGRDGKSWTVGTELLPARPRVAHQHQRSGNIIDAADRLVEMLRAFDDDGTGHGHA